MITRLLLEKFKFLAQIVWSIKKDGLALAKPKLKMQLGSQESALALLEEMLETTAQTFLMSFKLESKDYSFTPGETSTVLEFCESFNAQQLFLASGLVKNKSMSAALLKEARRKGWRSLLEEQPLPEMVEDWVASIQNIVAREGKNKLRFLGHSQSSKFVRLRFYPETIETKVKAINQYDEDIMTRLNVRLPVITPHPGHIAFDITLPENQWTTPLLKDFCLSLEEGEIQFPIGIDVEGKLLSAPISDPRYCHWLVGATTGGGKSVWLTQMIASLSRYHSSKYRLTVIDFKVPGVSLDFGWLNNTNMPARVITTKADALTFLENTVSITYTEKMRGCAKAGVAGLAIYNKKNEDSLPWDIIVIDEYADLMILGEGDEEAQKEYRIEAARINDLVTSLTAKGRAAGITLVVCTQRPEVNVVSGLIRNNLPAVIGLKMKDMINTKIIFGDIDSPAHKLLGKGDLFFRAAGDSHRCQSLFVDTEQAVEYVGSNLNRRGDDV